MTILDSSVVVDYLLGGRNAELVATELKASKPTAAPEIVVFEVVAALRRLVIRETIAADRGHGAVEDLRDLPLVLYPSGPLALPAWEMRFNFGIADAMFVVLAEAQGTPLLTADAGLARAATTHSAAEVTLLELG